MRCTGLVLALVLAGGIGLACAGEAREERPTVQVSATGWVEKAPEVARVVLAVETIGKTARDASEDNAEKMGAVMKALRKAGVAKDRVRTVSYNVYPRYDHESGRRNPRPIGYTATNSIEVTVDPIEKAGEVIDAAIEAGANRSNQLRFELKDPEAAHLEALADAMARARKQAEVLAGAVGKHLGDAARISTHGGGAPGPYPMAMRAMKEDAGTAIESGPVRTSATVEVTYTLSPWDVNK